MTYDIQSAHDFTPFGKTWREYVNGRNDRFQFTGYELDEESGLNNALARMYDPELRFGSVDPHFMSYPNWSPYVYSMANPIRFFDPTGKDPETYDIDKQGKITKIDDQKYYNENGVEVDKLQSRDNPENSIMIDKSVMRSAISKEMRGVHTDNGKTMELLKSDQYTFSDKLKAKEFFEFTARNSGVEWSNNRIQPEFGDAFSKVSTEHKEGFTIGASLWNGYENYKLLSSDHSHPDNSGIHGGDARGIGALNDINRQAIFRIFLPKSVSNEYQQYNINTGR
ncbi:MAG: RHS repeat-associated core domain-containing protein [Bacteroidota bacterium]